MLQVKLLSRLGQVPTKAHASDAGFDVYASHEITIHPSTTVPVCTDIAVSCPPGYAFQVWPRSGLALRNGIDTRAGLIDSGYRGEVKILLRNESPADFHVKRGDRIAQLVPVKLADCAEFRLVATLDVSVDADAVERGGNGFGSSGV